MERKLLTLFVLFLTFAALSSCGSDDGVMERPDYTSIRYDVEVSDAFLALYDVRVSYKKINGDVEQAQVNNLAWEYKERTDGQHPIDFTLSVVATARENIPQFTDNVYLLADVSMEYYTKKTSAKRTHQKPVETTISANSVASYLHEHPTITLANFSTE